MRVLNENRIDKLEADWDGSGGEMTLKLSIFPVLKQATVTFLIKMFFIRVSHAHPLTEHDSVFRRYYERRWLVFIAIESDAFHLLVLFGKLKAI